MTSRITPTSLSSNKSFISLGEIFLCFRHIITDLTFHALIYHLLFNPLLRASIVFEAKFLYPPKTIRYL